VPRRARRSVAAQARAPYSRPEETKFDGVLART
jgi:hypothetical protein